MFVGQNWKKKKDKTNKTLILPHFSPTKSSVAYKQVANFTIKASNPSISYVKILRKMTNTNSKQNPS
jgi:hypothetical protein